VEAVLGILPRKNRVAAAGLLAPLVLGAVVLPGIPGGTTTAAAWPARAFSTLPNAGQRGFGLRGTGTAAITTPVAYKPSSPASVGAVGVSGTRTLRLRADRCGRLHVSVPLSASLIAGGVALTIVGVSPG